MKLKPAPKNVLFEDTQLFQEGQNYFKEGKFQNALDRFYQFSEKYPNGEIYVAGRIAITLMELDRYGEAKELLRSILEESILPTEGRRKDYSCLYAECLCNLGKIRQAEEVCYKILQQFSGSKDDVEELLKNVSIHPHLAVLGHYMDWNESKECLKALDSIIEILANDGDKEEASFYSKVLIALKNNYSIRPYLVLADYYNKPGWYYKCLPLLNKLEKSMVPLVDRNNALSEILCIYKLSPCFRYSKYCHESNVQSVLNSAEELAREAIERAQRYSLENWIQRIPTLDLEKYFAREPQLLPLSY